MKNFLNLFLLKKNIIQQTFEVNSFLSSLIKSNVSLNNLTNEILFRDIEANILLDCTRTINDENKLL